MRRALVEPPVPFSDTGIIFAEAPDWEDVTTNAPISGDMEPEYTAVIDLGSGSARAVVMQVNPGGGIEIVAQRRVNLNLMSHVDDSGALDQSGVASAVAALEDFALLAGGYGIQAIHAVGTAALRESGNAAAIIDAAVNRFGIPLRIIDGSDEAAYCFIGAIHGLPVSDGILADIGGGSMEIVRFSGRAMGWSASLPLGSLRIANQFQLTDLASPEDIHAAYQHIHATLSKAGVPRLRDGETLVGSGGSVRLLSRLLRGREPYPIIRMHGYQMDAGSLAGLARELSAASLKERAGIDGMNPERGHSIVGGAIAAHALSQYAGADSMTVSGQGLREGLARLPEPLPLDCAVSVPPLSAIRTASLVDLVGRFVPRFSQRGKRRAALARNLGASVWGTKNRGVRDALEYAAFVLDVGNAVDFYNRSNRTASIIVRTDLPGFTHEESAFLAAILLASERKKLPPRFRRSRLLDKDSIKLIGQAAVALTVVDELDNRLPHGAAASEVRFIRQNGTLQVTTPAWSQVAGQDVRERWKAAFGEEIDIVRC